MEIKKQEHLYAIIHKETGEIYIDCDRLSIYYSQENAEEIMRYFSVDQDKYCTHRFDSKELHEVVLKDFIKN